WNCVCKRRKGSGACCTVRWRARRSSCCISSSRNPKRFHRESFVSLDNECKRCKMLTHDELKAKALRDPHVRAEYNALEAEFAWLAELLQARNRVGLTQIEVAERMGTTPSAVARLEA